MGIIDDIHHVDNPFAGMQSKTTADTLKNTIATLGRRGKDEVVEPADVHSRAKGTVGRNENCIFDRLGRYVYRFHLYVVYHNYLIHPIDERGGRGLPFPIENP